MSIRTTITLDDDVAGRVRDESRARATSFRETLNDLLRTALLRSAEKRPPRKIEIIPTRMGYKPGLNYDSVESLLEYGEGERHR